MGRADGAITETKKQSPGLSHAAAEEVTTQSAGAPLE